MSDLSIQVSWETGQQDQQDTDKRGGLVMTRFLAAADVESVEGRLAIGGIVPSTAEKQRQMLLLMYWNVDLKLGSCCCEMPDFPSNDALQTNEDGDRAMMERYLADNEESSVTSRLVGGGQAPTLAEKRSAMALVLQATAKKLDNGPSQSQARQKPRGKNSRA